MQLLVFMVLWSVLSLLWFWAHVLLKPVSLFTLRVDWPGFCMVRVFDWWGFSKRF